MKLDSKGGIDVVLVAAILFVVAIGGFTIYRITEQNRTDSSASDSVDTSDVVSSYGECVDAGGAILESYPEQCQYVGQSWTRELTDEEKNALSDITEDQADAIFNAVVKDLALDSDRIVRFSVFSTDKVTYSLGPTLVFAFLDDDEWQIAYEGQSIPDCIEVDDVPQKYRPACSLSASETENALEDGEGGLINANYPEGSKYAYL